MTTEPDFLHATRTSYDTLAVDYEARARGELDAKPMERALLGLFAEQVLAAPSPLPVLDVGCGTGRVTAHLTDLGVPVTGVDLSPGMVDVARATHPGCTFTVGSMLDLDVPDHSLGGVLAWYSTIHVPDDHLPRALAEFARVLAPGGQLLLGFQSGTVPLRLSEAYGHPVALDFHRRTPERMAELLTAAGLSVRSTTLRQRDVDGPFPERAPQAFVFAHAPAEPHGTG
ncbi:class I SAM-dependent DNA methyltransferase [Streptomyces sp. NPDC059578]|uniref:class I SAM-dependent DNA methyltransferase n=1 Tax=unclassified Streptomyces TaxID=2593676 RepID=UPI00364968B6